MRVKCERRRGREWGGGRARWKREGDCGVSRQGIAVVGFARYPSYQVIAGPPPLLALMKCSLYLRTLVKGQTWKLVLRVLLMEHFWRPKLLDAVSRC